MINKWSNWISPAIAAPNFDSQNQNQASAATTFNSDLCKAKLFIDIDVTSLAKYRLTVRLCWHYQSVLRTLWFLWCENRPGAVRHVWLPPKSLPVNAQITNTMEMKPRVFDIRRNEAIGVTFNRSYSVPCSSSSFWVASTEFGNSVSWITRMNISKLHDTWCVKLENFSRHWNDQWTR